MGRGSDLRHAKGDAGAATLEFIFVAGVFILLAFALLDLALALNAKLVLTQAARTGLRQACVDGGASPRTLKAIEEQLRSGGIDPRTVDVTVSPRSASYGTMIRVALAHDHPLRTPLAVAVGRSKIHLRATLIGRSEYLGASFP